MKYNDFLYENAYFKYRAGVEFHVRVNCVQLDIILMLYRDKIKALIVDEESASDFDEPSDWKLSD